MIPIVNTTTSSIQAKSRLTATPAAVIMSFFRQAANIKLPVAKASFSLLGSSPPKATNHPRGIALILYLVPDLSVQKIKSLGGIPSQNSLTWTPDFFAAIKCPSSWIMTKTINIKIQSKIQNIKVIKE